MSLRFFAILLSTLTVMTCTTKLIAQEPTSKEPIAETINYDSSKNQEGEDINHRDKFDFSLGVGAGIVELLHGDFRLHFSRYLAIGVSIGTYPAEKIIFKFIREKDLRKVDSENSEYQSLTNTSVLSFSEYIRLMPFGKAFFVEYAFDLWRIKAQINGIVGAEDLINETIDVRARTVFRVPMNGIRAGWCFITENGFYFELMSGLHACSVKEQIC